jgi:hypothetical protein
MGDIDRFRHNLKRKLIEKNRYLNKYESLFDLNRKSHKRGDLKI